MSNQQPTPDGMARMATAIFGGQRAVDAMDRNAAAAAAVATARTRLKLVVLYALLILALVAGAGALLIEMNAIVWVITATW